MKHATNVFIDAAMTEWEDLGSGVQRKILGFDEQLMMTRVKFEKGAVGAVHSHPHTQVAYIEHGSFEVQVGSEKKRLKQGDCYFIPSGIEHGVVALEDSILVDVFAPMRKDFVKDPGSAAIVKP
jgi:quercetin dioxygenase-like cupin family protein